MSLQKDIYDKLKKAIIYGELGPGEKISEFELAKKMHASRTPVREAFRQLQVEGYITAVQNRGAFVTKLPPKEIGEVYDIVRLLEGYATELAVQRISDSDLTKLKKHQQKLAAYASKRKFRDYIEENTEFHHFITCLSGNDCLARTVTELRARIYRYRLTSVMIPGYFKRYASDHEKIIRLMTKRDAGLARKHMEEHVNFVKEVLVNFLEDNPGY